MRRISKAVLWAIALLLLVVIGLGIAYPRAFLFVPLPPWVSLGPTIAHEDEGPPGIEADPRFTTRDPHPLFAELTNEELAQKLVNVICNNAYCLDMSQYEYFLSDEDRGETEGFTMKLKQEHLDPTKPGPRGRYHHCRLRNERWLLCIHDTNGWTLHAFESGHSDPMTTPWPLPSKGVRE